jgi:hypothetical protein
VTGDASLRDRFSTNLVRDAHDEGVPARAAWWGFWLPFLGLAAFAVLFVVVRSAYYWLLSEDHAIEWLQFFLLLLTLPVAVLGALAAARRGHWLTVAFLVVVSLGVVFLVGEEVSWGQRILGIVDSVSGNRQGERNIHNIDDAGGIPIETLFRIAQATIGLIGVVLPFLVRWDPPRLRGAAWRVITPPIFLTTSFLVVLGFRTQRLLLPLDIAALSLIQEWAEVCLYGALATWMTLIWLRESGRRAASLSPSADGAVAVGTRKVSTAVLTVVGIVGVLTAIAIVRTMQSGILPGNV